MGGNEDNIMCVIVCRQYLSANIFLTAMFWYQLVQPHCDLLQTKRVQSVSVSPLSFEGLCQVLNVLIIF